MKKKWTYSRVQSGTYTKSKTYDFIPKDIIFLKC